MKKAYTDVGQEEPGFALSSTLHEGVARETQDVGVIEQSVHLHLRLCLLPSLPVMTQDSLQSVETAILSSFYQINVAKTAERGTASRNQSTQTLSTVVHDVQKKALYYAWYTT